MSPDMSHLLEGCECCGDDGATNIQLHHPSLGDPVATAAAAGACLLPPAVLLLLRWLLLQLLLESIILLLQVVDNLLQIINKVPACHTGRNVSIITSPSTPMRVSERP